MCDGGSSRSGFFFIIFQAITSQSKGKKEKKEKKDQNTVSFGFLFLVAFKGVEIQEETLHTTHMERWKDDFSTSHF